MNNGNGYIVKLRNGGLSYREIGQRLNLSGQRIVQMLSPRKKPDLKGEELITARDTAAVLGIHGNIILRWGDESVIPMYRFDKRQDRRFLRADLKKFLAESREP